MSQRGEATARQDRGSIKARRRRILTLAMPIIGGMISQNVLNLVDTAMVGTLGDDALAAVGIASFANFMSIAFITGMSAGVQAMAARWLGEGRTHEMAIPLNGGLLLVVLIAIPWSVFLELTAPFFFPFLVSDPSVEALGESYFRIRVLAVTAVGVNFAFRGYWNAVNLSRLYMGTLAFMHAINIFLNWVLIFGNLGAPQLGVAGAATGTVIATYIGTVCYFVLALRHARPAGFLSGIPERSTLATMVRLCVPAGVQQFFFAAGMTVFFWILGRIGTPELAAGNVLVNLTLMTILPAIGFGLAAATLVGQSLGAGDRSEASVWPWRVGRIAMVVVGVIVLPALIVPDLILSGFIHSPETLELARLPLQLVALVAPLDALGMVIMHAHLGAGHTRHVMVVALGAQWGLFLPLTCVMALVMGYGLVAIWCVNATYRLLTLVVFAATWRQGRWADVKM